MEGRGGPLGLPRATAQLSLCTERQAGSTGKVDLCGSRPFPARWSLGLRLRRGELGQDPGAGTEGWQPGRLPLGHVATVGRGFFSWKRGQGRRLIRLFSSHLCFPACATCPHTPTSSLHFWHLEGGLEPWGAMGEGGWGTCPIRQQLSSPRPARTFFAGPAVHWGRGVRAVDWEGAAPQGRSRWRCRWRCVGTVLEGLQGSSVCLLSSVVLRTNLPCPRQEAAVSREMGGEAGVHPSAPRGGAGCGGGLVHTPVRSVRLGYRLSPLTTARCPSILSRLSLRRRS